MTRHPITVTADTPLRIAAQIMLTQKIGGLPVMCQDKLVGIITETDIFRVLVQQLMEEEARVPRSDAAADGGLSGKQGRVDGYDECELLCGTGRGV